MTYTSTAIKGFYKEDFMKYLSDKVSGLEHVFTWETVEKIIDYATEHEHVSKDQFAYFISDMLPEVEFGEVAMFCEDGMLTENGKAEKKRAADKESFKHLSDDQILAFWNALTEDVNKKVYKMDELNSYLEGLKPLEVLQAVEADFDFSDKYFYDDEYYGLVSFDDIHHAPPINYAMLENEWINEEHIPFC